MLIHRRSSRRLLTALAAVGALAAFGPAAGADAAPAKCKNATTKAGKLSVTQLRGAVLCLLNRERRANGVAPLTYVKSTATLGRAAMSHAKNGVTTRSWTSAERSHMEPGAPGDQNQQIGDRIRAAGWCPTGSFSVAEITYNDTDATATRAVNWWMNSPGHRAQVLSAGLKAAGIGVARGMGDPSAPVRKDSAAFVVNFGTCNGGAVSK